MRKWQEINEEMEMLLSQTEDEYEQLKIKIKYNELIRKAWEAERIEKNSNVSLFDLVGTKVVVNAGSRWFHRILKFDGVRFYVLADNQKAIVKYNAIWNNFDVDHWELK